VIKICGLHDNDIGRKSKIDMVFVKLYHIKVMLFGDKILEKEGKTIPCKRCGSTFRSYCSFDYVGYRYHVYCRSCELLAMMI